MDFNRNQNPFSEKLLDIILSYENENLSIAKLANHCFMSERNFRLIFTKHFEMSPLQFILKKKLDAAYELLTSTDIKIKEVALNCGFSNQYYFCRMFKKKFSFPPSDLRKFTQ